jgi:DNA-binding CsgD family transcriptional regulator
MIDSLQRIQELEEVRISLQFKVNQLDDILAGFKAEIADILQEEDRIFEELGRVSMRDSREFRAQQANSDARLTPSEQAVAHYMRADPPITNKEIGQKLNIAERTVKFHLANIRRKLGISLEGTGKGWHGDNPHARIVLINRLRGT